ncbi:MAG: hypothetical protein ACTSRI_22290 [Promethearchaeota archaeon]
MGSKEEGKVLKDKTCIYYLVIIKLSKKTRAIPINDLVAEIRMGTKDFTDKLAEKNGIDEEKEELLGVENMIKVVDLERKVRVLEVDLEEKEKEINAKDKEIDEEKKLHEEIVKKKDKEIERLKAQLKDK